MSITTSSGQWRELFQAFDHSNDAFLVFDKEWHVMYMNDRARRCYPAATEPAPDSNFWNDHPELLGTPYQAQADRAMSERTPSAFKFVHEPTGKIYQIRLTPVMDGLASLAIDISEQERSQAALAESEERYRTFIQQSSEGIWRCEFSQPVSTSLPTDQQIEAIYATGYLAECNDAMARMYGFAHAEELTGTRLEDILLRSDPGNIAYLRAVIDSGYRLIDAESHEVDRFGNSVYFLNNLIGVVESGFLLRAWGTQRDVTAHRRTEARLRATEERFRLMADSAPVLIWLSDADKLRTWFNKAWLDFTGRGMEQELGSRWAEAVHPDDLEQCLAAYSFSFDSRSSYSMEYRLRHHSGEYRWLLDNGIPLYGLNGQFTGYIGSCIDIHDRKQAEQEREKTVSAQQAALAESEHANRMKDEFLSTLSHELRTPLNAILGWSQLLRSEDMPPEEIHAGLETIERNARVQTQIIDDLLDMNRIISGKIRLDIQKVDLTQVISDALETVRHGAEAKGIRLQQVLDPLAGPVSGDPSRLQQVVWNLLSNAIKFTGRGGRIQILLERVNSHVEITVSDTGQGISPEFLPLVFERFRQADSSTRRKHGGLGLGLAIVKNLTELHGGAVRAKSPGVNQGATFSIALPLTVVQHKDDPQERQPRVQGTEQEFNPPSLKGVKVLVVDDEPDARELVRRVLESADAAVITVGSAQEALERLIQEGPDVLVSDIGMPDEDGYDLIRRVRALPQDKGGATPALALTAFARSEDRQRAFMAGFQLHVAKPVEPSELVAVVASLAGKI